MPYDFSGVVEGFRSGFGDVARARRQRMLDEAAVEERKYKRSQEEGQQAYERRRALDFEGATDPAEKAFAAKLAKRRLIDDRLKAAQADYLEERYRGGPREASEQAIGAKLKSTESGIEGLEEAGREAGRRWYLPRSAETPEYTEEQAAELSELRANRRRLLGLGAPTAPPDDGFEDRMAGRAPGGKSRLTPEQRRAIIERAKRRSGGVRGPGG